jgi:hypothetical protein
MIDVLRSLGFYDFSESIISTYFGKYTLRELRFLCRSCFKHFSFDDTSLQDWHVSLVEQTNGSSTANSTILKFA